MKIKNLLITGIVALLFAMSIEVKVHAASQEMEMDDSIYEVTEECEYLNPNYCGNNSLTNGLDSNQTTLFYMYSNKNGHYFLDPLAEYENVILVEKADMPKLESKLHHGKKFIGTFTDSDLWELVGLQEVFYE